MSNKMKTNLTGLIGLLVLEALILLFALPPRHGISAREEDERHEFQELHMGTRVRIVLYAGDKADAERAAHKAFARIGRLDRVCSDYRNDSELTRFVEAAGSGLVGVDPDLYQLLDLSRDWAAKTNGLFDVTLAPVVQLWRRARRTRELPDPATLRAARNLVGINYLALDPVNRHAGLARAGMRIDLGGIAKGFAAQEALREISRTGIRSALVAIGGDIVAGLPPPGTAGWRVGVAPLDGPPDQPRLYLSLRQSAVSTSGDAAQSVVIDGIRYSHIVDPRTGVGLRGHRSVTVVAADGTTADVLATTLNILGPSRGMRLLERLRKSDPLLAALFQHTDQRLHPTIASAGWTTHLAPESKTSHQGER